MLRRSSAQSGSALGSKTAHWLRLSMLCSRKMEVRRTDTYFHSASVASVWDPPTVTSPVRDIRSALAPSASRLARSLPDSGCASAVAPEEHRAGRHVPHRIAASAPATKPLGGAGDSGSSHGT